MATGASVKSGDVLVLVGTRKGGFILSSDAARKSWSLSGPHWPGRDIFHMAYDPRDGTTWAAINSTYWGSEVQRSRDLGGTWEGPRTARSSTAARASA